MNRYARRSCRLARTFAFPKSRQAVRGGTSCTVRSSDRAWWRRSAQACLLLPSTRAPRRVHGVRAPRGRFTSVSQCSGIICPSRGRTRVPATLSTGPKASTLRLPDVRNAVVEHFPSEVRYVPYSLSLGFDTPSPTVVTNPNAWGMSGTIRSSRNVRRSATNQPNPLSYPKAQRLAFAVACSLALVQSKMWIIFYWNRLESQSVNSNQFAFSISIILDADDLTWVHGKAYTKEISEMNWILR